MQVPGGGGGGPVGFVWTCMTLMLILPQKKRILETRLHAFCSDLLQLGEWMQLVNQAKRHALFCSVEGSAESCDGSANERKARAAASMGLRIVSEQAAQLAKQGSMIPHLYPERQLSKSPETPPPLGMFSIGMCSVLSYINQYIFIIVILYIYFASPHQCLSITHCRCQQILGSCQNRVRNRGKRMGG